MSLFVVALVATLGLTGIALVARRRAAPPLSAPPSSQGAEADLAALPWDELERIEIVTTDEGPFAEDVFWLFVARDGRGAVLPGAQVGEALFERLKGLPNVDYTAIVSAMGSTEPARFCVYRASASAPETAHEARA